MMRLAALILLAVTACGPLDPEPSPPAMCICPAVGHQEPQEYPCDSACPGTDGGKAQRRPGGAS